MSGMGFSYEILRQITQFLVKATSHHPGANNVLAEQSAHEQNPIARKIWYLSIQEILVVAWPCISSIVHPSTPQGNQCEVSHFQASVGACNLILHIHVVVKWQLSSRVSPDQYHVPISRARVSTHGGYVFFWSYPLTSC